MFDMHGETVCYNEKDETAVIIDQTLLPGEIVTLELWEKEEMYDAIKRLAVRGAPAIGGFRGNRAVGSGRTRQNGRRKNAY